jgi:cytochrome c
MKPLHRRLVAAIAVLLFNGAAAAGDGETLATDNGCMSCHSGNKPMVAPSFAKISSRYQGRPGAQAELAASIRNGSKAKWGVMVMRPNEKISNEDALAIADWLVKH